MVNVLSERSQSGKFDDVSYSSSALTHLMRESLGGNAKLAVICAVTPENKYLLVWFIQCLFMKIYCRDHLNLAGKSILLPMACMNNISYLTLNIVKLFGTQIILDYLVIWPTAYEISVFLFFSLCHWFGAHLCRHNSETISTLRFGKRVKLMPNEPLVNEISEDDVNGLSDQIRQLKVLHLSQGGRLCFQFIEKLNLIWQILLSLTGRANKSTVKHKHFSWKQWLLQRTKCTWKLESVESEP